MMIEQVLNSIKGQVIDYDMTNKGTLFVLVKSEKGNCSIRQAFRNGYGEYNGFTMVKMLRNMGTDVARMEFNDLMKNMQA